MKSFNKAVPPNVYYISNSGFTILELIIVMVIAAIILTISLLTWQLYAPKIHLTQAANQLASSLRLARLEAISQNTSTWIQLDLSPDVTDVYSIWIDSDQSGDISSADTERGPFQLPRGIQVESFTSNPISFNSRGKSNGSTIFLTNNEKTKEIQVLDSTGQVKVINR